jgi:hypothetical protein
MKRKGFILQKEFLYRECRGKIGIKKIGIIIMNSEIFDENFMNFGQIELLK